MIRYQIKKITEQLAGHERRISELEGKGVDKSIYKKSVRPAKGTTLVEVIHGKDFKSGQEKIAVIVGYAEKIAKKEQIREADLKQGWKDGKFGGKYNPNLLARAISDRLVRNIEDNLDLSQTGEKFFNDFLDSNARRD